MSSTATLLPDVDAGTSSAASLLEQFERDGLVRLPRLVSDDTLRGMQQAFAGRLRHLRWNNVDGYERTERYRFMVQDMLTLAQGFVDVALHPLVQSLIGQFVGPRYVLCEAKGWRSLPTNRDFHGWHGDSWYDQSRVTGPVPREVKLAIYLTDVRSGAFQYIKGSHGKPPHHLSRTETDALPLDRMEEVLGPAGTAVLFDTSGIHRQGIPIREPRQAIFYNYHDPAVPLQQEDVDYYRYHPLLLNAALLGGLSAEDCRVLGFGEQAAYQPGFIRRSEHRMFEAFLQHLYEARLLVGEWSSRIGGRALRLLRRR
jgi:hypothetical protein